MKQNFAFYILNFAFTLQYFRCQGNDLHIPFIAELPGNWPEDAGAARFIRLVQQYYRVVIETDIRSIFPAQLILCTYDYSLCNSSFLNAAGRDGIFYSYNYLIAYFSIVLTAVSQNTNTQYLFGPTVISYVQSAFLLDHCISF